MSVRLNDELDDMVVSFNEADEPNPELAADVEMTMQETRMFSSKDILAALSDDENISEEMGETRVIDMRKIEEESENIYEENLYSEESDSDMEFEEEEYEEESDDVLTDDDMETFEVDDSFEFEGEAAKPKKKKTSSGKKRRKAKSIGEIIGGLGMTGVIGAVLAVVIVALIIVVAVSLSKNNKSNKTYDEFATAGLMFEQLTGIGSDGITAIGEKARIDSIVPDVEVEVVSDSEEEEDVNALQASVSFVSIERDLKIKFTDKMTGSFIKGVRFEVNAKGPDGKDYNWVDDDMDGMIYMSNMLPGNYEVVIVSNNGYKFPETGTIVKVQDTPVYQAINMMSEAVAMKDVDLSKDEFTGEATTQEKFLDDTVEWVSSTATKMDTTYTKVDKNTINAPSYAYVGSSYRRVDGVSVEVGKIISLEFNKQTLDTVANDYKFEWTVSDSSKLEISDGATTQKATVKGLAEGQDIKVSCKVTYLQKNASTTDYKDLDTQDFTVSVTAAANPNVDVESVTLSGNKEVAPGGTITLSAAVSPDNATDKTLTWTSSDESIAKVDSNGVVTGVKDGTAKISATSKNGKVGTYDITVKTAKLELIVKDSAGNAIAEGSTITVPFGVDYGLKISVSGASDTSVTCKSSTESSATISNAGVITPKAADTSTEITITTNAKNAENKQISLKFKVSVKKDAKYDTKTALLDKDKKQVYVLDGSNYRAATFADYYKFNDFYVQNAATIKYTGWQTIGSKVFYYDKNGKYVTGEQIIGGAKYSFGSDGALKTENGVLGIDVSTYQGNIDWAAVKSSGISFVIIRCGFRGYGTGKLVVDDKFEQNISGANAAGLKVGVYFFSQAINEAEAIEEASLCVNLCTGKRVSYPIFIDTEKVGNGARADGLDKATRTKVCAAFCKTIENSGYTPGIYASKFWLRDNLNVNELGNYKIWMAQYCTTPDYTGRYEVWQRSSKGQVKGISGNVDMDVSYLGY